jgi:flagellar motility protein MotE (MotC chaperone)
LFLSIQRERDALRKREESLSKREEHVRQEEARFKKIQGEIEERLEALVEIQTSIQELIQEKKGLEDTILKKLAKVYESTPPEQAGPMISELDVKLAAQILIRMDGRKAGKIWGYVSPERASQISSEIANLQ